MHHKVAVLVKDLLEAFQPAKEISDPKRFSGRKKQLEKGAELLLSSDHIFIHGNRGIGKSSLARQLSIIASGKNDLLVSIDSILAGEKFDFVTCFFVRDSSVRNINQLLYRLMIDESALAQWSSYAELDEVGVYDLDGELNPKLVSDFWFRVSRISKLTENGLAIFIDEFELIEDHTGFASLIKANPEKCIFIVTGIGKTEQDLVRDHESIKRQLSTGTLRVPNMSEEELSIIVSKAQDYLSNEITFSAAAVQKLVKLVSGHPYLLHLIGKEALRVAFTNKKTLISEELIDEALQKIVSESIDSYLEARYLKVIGNNKVREKFLRIIALQKEDVVYTGQLYPEAEDQGIDNPSYWLGELQKEVNGSELEKVSDQYYKITDPLFKAYISATPARLETNIEEAPEETSDLRFSLVHVSDLHFGNNHYFDNLPISGDHVPDADKPSLQKYLIDSLSNSYGPADFLAVTGDLTQSALTSEFKKAAEFITAVAQTLNGGVSSWNKNIAIIPGNHDVNWGMKNADPDARYAGFTPYIRFRNSLGYSIDNQVEPERLYEVHNLIEKWNCVIVGFNSCVLEGPDDHRGYIGESQFQNALEEVNALCGKTKPLKIAMLHHHIIPVSSIEAGVKRPEYVLFDSAYIKDELLRNNFNIVLHGHRHHGHEEMINQGGEDGSSLLIVGCGSTGVDISERGSQAIQYNRLSIRRKKDSDTVAVSVARYMFDPNRRKFYQSEDHKAKTFRFEVM
ncbi:metallophosphoesterase [Pseudomonas aeruginosa]|uniref:metallophosphoesterase n=1 Tax=Pseudomonas aeruginosa TaxID=287 RepID=UPI001F4AC0CE|nr:metallophosphoesterase [Pseudomonas aeruginosa]MCS8153542.1 metallophosphoesterase [Pseudomonas aeruginosa]